VVERETDAMPGNNHLRRPIAAVAVVVCLVTAACSGAATNAPDAGTPGADAASTDGAGQGRGPSPATDASASAAGEDQAGPVASGPVTGRVGDTLTFAEFGSGDEIEVTLDKVFDPATPASANTTAPKGARWVGLQITTVNHSPDLASQSELVDGIASDGSSLTTDDVYQGFSVPIGSFAECTQTAGAAQDVGVGQPYTSCPAFVLPDGVTVSSVGVKVGGAEIFSSVVPTDQATWTVP
jgi:hypothetical protein